MNLEEQPAQLESTPKPFTEIPGLWLRLGGMTETFFSQELPRASVRNTLLSMLVLSGLSALISVVIVLLSTTALGTANTTNPLETVLGIGVISIVLFCVQLIVPPLSFYLNNGIMYASALLFGGRGTFSAQSYLSSLFFVPLTLISLLSGFFSLIPTVGTYVVYAVSLGIVLFQLVYTVRLLKVVHNFSTGKAVAAVFAPVILLLVPICLIAALTVMGPMVGSVFSSINASLGTPAP